MSPRVCVGVNAITYELHELKACASWGRVGVGVAVRV